MPNSQSLTSLRVSLYRYFADFFLEPFQDDLNVNWPRLVQAVNALALKDTPLPEVPFPEKREFEMQFARLFSLGDKPELSLFGNDWQMPEEDEGETQDLCAFFYHRDHWHPKWTIETREDHLGMILGFMADTLEKGEVEKADEFLIRVALPFLAVFTDRLALQTKSPFMQAVGVLIQRWLIIEVRHAKNL